MAELLDIRRLPRERTSTATAQAAPVVSIGAAQPIELLVVQPTPFCNLDCSYCYLPDRGNRQRMTEETLQLLCLRLADCPLLGDTLSVVWHAGEPLVLPPDYYERAFRLFAESLGERVEIRHCFQTNATLIDDAWIALIQRWRVSVGVSLDGPQWLHDRYRTTRSGAGSFAKTVAGVARLKGAQIPFHVIAVLTRDSLTQADAIFDFFHDESLWNIGFNIEEKEAANPHSSLEVPEARALLHAFLARFIRRNAAHGNPIMVREFAGMVGAVLGKVPDIAVGQQSTPLKILNVDVSGGMSAFSPELLGARAPDYGDFIFGRLATHAVDDLFEEPNFRRVCAEIERGVANCRASCGYFALCGGGAPGNKFFEHGRFDGTETHYCQLTKKAVADAVMDALEDEAAGLAGNNRR